MHGGGRTRPAVSTHRQETRAPTGAANTSEHAVNRLPFASGIDRGRKGTRRAVGDTVKDASTLHDAGHSLGLWLFSDTTAWFEFVLHAVLLAAPIALALLLAVWGLQLARYAIRRRRQKTSEALAERLSGTLANGVFRYIFKHSRRSQFLLLGAAAIALPLLYAGLELPKMIINNAISSGHFPVQIGGWSFAQTDYLFLLCALYLVVIFTSACIKYAMSVHKGRVAEVLLRRLRLTIYRYWRRGTKSGDRSAVIPMLVQEVEPIGGFAGDAYVLPVFQGGTFLTILIFMLLQDPVLGAAAVTLLPVQLALIPRLQIQINGLTRRRAHEMRGLGGALGREIAADTPSHGETRREVAASLRRITDIRFEIYRKKFFMKGLNNFITQLTPFFFYTVGGYLVIEDRLSFGALVAVLAAHKDFSAPLRELLKYYQSMEDVRVRFHETRLFLAAAPTEAAIVHDSPDAHRRPISSDTVGSPVAKKRRRPFVAATSVLAILPRRKKLQPCAPQRYSA